jgi:GT2 family glycosyltransferase
MLVHFPVHTSTVSIRRDVFDQVGLFNEEYVVGEDYDLWVRIAKTFPEGIHYIHDELARYHWCSHPHSLTARFRHTRKQDEIFNEIRKIHGLI